MQLQHAKKITNHAHKGKAMGPLIKGKELQPVMVKHKISADSLNHDQNLLIQVVYKGTIIQNKFTHYNNIHTINNKS